MRERHEVSAATHHVMQANKSRDTKPELKVRAALRQAGLPGYRLQWRAAPGRPDICYPGRKVAIFVNGCFWHRCPYCALPGPRSNVEFWRAKFARNRARDERDHEQLVADGWTVIVVWECRLKRGRFERTMREVVREVRRAGGKAVPRECAMTSVDSASEEARDSYLPGLAWPAGGRVVEVGAMPLWRRRRFARRLRLRHSEGQHAVRRRRAGH